MERARLGLLVLLCGFLTAAAPIRDAMAMASRARSSKAGAWSPGLPCPFLKVWGLVARVAGLGLGPVGVFGALRRSALISPEIGTVLR